MKANRIIFIITAVLFLSGILFGQATTARIHGKVTLEDGITVIPGVLVIAASPKMVGEASTITDEKGIFRFFALNQGTYTITFELKGFSTVLRKNISIQVGQDMAVNSVMKTSTIQETI